MHRIWTHLAIHLFRFTSEMRRNALDVPLMFLALLCLRLYHSCLCLSLFVCVLVFLSFCQSFVLSIGPSVLVSRCLSVCVRQCFACLVRQSLQFCMSSVRLSRFFIPSTRAFLPSFLSFCFHFLPLVPSP